MRTSTIVSLVLVFLLLAVAGLFTIQNLSRLAELSLSFGPLGGFQLAEPMPLPYLLWISTAAGLVIGAAWGLQQRFYWRRELTKLKQKYHKATL